MSSKQAMRRGRLKEQASAQAYEEAGDALRRSFVAMFGKDFGAHGDVLRDLLFVTKHCPDSPPVLAEIADKNLRVVLLHGWRLLHALCRFNKLDRDFIDRNVVVRSGETFRAMSRQSDRPPVDPVRAALYPLAQKFEDQFDYYRAGMEREAPVTRLKPMTVGMLRNWLIKHSFKGQIPNDKTLRQMAKDMLIPMAGRGTSRMRSRKHRIG